MTSTATTPNRADSAGGHSLIIDGVTVPTKYKALPLGNLVLDPDNPRIQHAVKRKFKNGQVKHDDLMTLIYEQPGVPALLTRIRDNGGLMDPIYIRPDGRIIEGNSRAVIYLKLNKAKPNEEVWKTIPAYIVPKITEEQVAILQGAQHVVGKNTWRAYENAGHLHGMHKRHGMTPERIAKVLGIRENSVKQVLQAYSTMTEQLLPKMGGGNELQKWSYVQEFYKSKSLAEYRAKPENVEEFVSMVADGRFKKGAEVRKFGDVLQVPAALRVLKKKDISAALIEVAKVDPTVNSKIMKKLKGATSVLKSVPAKDLQMLLNEESSRQIFSELAEAIRAAARSAKVKLS
jgi:hypothetical protein